MPRRRRPWTAADEQRLADLVTEVEKALPVVGEDAVKHAVLKAVGLETMQELSDALGVHRPNLSNVLGGKTPGYDIRRQLDTKLKIPPGGMERLLSLIGNGGA